MVLELWDIAVVFLLLLICRIIWVHVDANRIAMGSAKAYCTKNDVQLLDQSVVLSSFRIVRSVSSLLAVSRVYTFEFSSIGDRRYRGRLIMHGFRVMNVELEPYKII